MMLTVPERGAFVDDGENEVPFADGEMSPEAPVPVCPEPPDPPDPPDPPSPEEPPVL